jgi:hypothetical protein
VETKVLTFSILLMNSLGLQITPRKVKRFVGKITAATWEPGELEVLEALVLLWNAAANGSGRNQTKLKSLKILKGAGARPLLGGCADSKLKKQPLFYKTPGDLQRERDGTVKTEVDLQATGKPDCEGDVQNISNQSKVAGPITERVNLPETAKSGSENGALSMNDQILSEKVQLPGRYIYGIGWGTPEQLNLRGIDNTMVFGISYREITAVVHACNCRPYQSEQRDTALEWIKQHQVVLDEMGPLFKSILPVGFDIIVDGTLSADPDQLVRDWLAERYEQIMKLLQRLAGKLEYGIQAVIAKEKLILAARDSNPRIGELEQKIGGMTKGKAFLFQKELSGLIRETLDCRREEMKQRLKEMLAPLAFEIKEENTLGKQQTEQDELIADFSILANTDQVEKIGNVLEEFQNRFGVTVIFSGPWPPYNFVEELE